ncbi:PREDICTED: chymotrypsin-1-like [Ceratosolen solmsi marchali]|uniref:Chymotrypsin-1-like n=1 Tax=Ceratosolen solmsi marchali TaxID=326594 RepID=A0AAJ6YGH9_9HYME|nr:PREDICTED: chymotrypsin-1-like [Ceratosolen solmsi marchali]
MDFRIVICLCFSLFTDVFSKESRIYGGNPAAIHEFPHLVSIRTDYSNQHLCGGSIISQRNILTAAHCLRDVLRYLEGVKVYTGTATVNDIYGNAVRIQDVHLHPHCDIMNPDSTFYHDIAMIKLSTKIEFNNLQNKIALPTRAPKTGDFATIAGWGKTEYDLINSPILMQSPVVILNNTDCASRVPLPMGDTQFCTYYSAGIGICSGDDGGSVVSNGELYGVISFSHGCAQGIPDSQIENF